MVQDNGFIATIVEQTGGQTKGGQLSADAPTIIEKYLGPVVMPNDRMAEPIEQKEMEREMSDFGDADMMPTLWLDDKQLPSAAGLQIGDKVYFKIEAEVSNYSFNENINGVRKHEYTFKLKKGFVKKED